MLTGAYAYMEGRTEEETAECAARFDVRGERPKNDGEKELRGDLGKANKIYAYRSTVLEVVF